MYIISLKLVLVPIISETEFDLNYCFILIRLQFNLLHSINLS